VDPWLTLLICSPVRTSPLETSTECLRCASLASFVLLYLLLFACSCFVFSSSFPPSSASAGCIARFGPASSSFSPYPPRPVHPCSLRLIYLQSAWCSIIFVRLEKVCFLIPKCFLFLADPDACVVFISRFLLFGSDIFGVSSYDSDLKLLDLLAPFN
jgi:hypothetical protein